jgi:hypothetical protein
LGFQVLKREPRKLMAESYETLRSERVLDTIDEVKDMSKPDEIAD